METTRGTFRTRIIENKKRTSALFRAAPEAMKAFGGLMAAVSKDGALPALHKELMALAIATVTRCDGCIIHHVEEAIRYGAQRAQVIEAITVAVEMGGGPATVYGSMALAAFDEMSAK